MIFMTKNKIRCSPAMMARVLSLMTSHPLPFYDYLIKSESNTEPRTGEVHLFRHGAKLVRSDQNDDIWYVIGYYSDRKDEEAAGRELKAGYYVYRAVRILEETDEKMSTPAEFNRTWRGLWATYPSSQRSPSDLNYATAHGRV